MNIYLDNKANGERFTSEKKPTLEEALELFYRLKAPDGILIMQLPSGLGLDFAVQADDLLEVEFYPQNPSDSSNSLVSREIAEKIIRRAFEERSGRLKDIYADLIVEWNF